MSMVYALSYLIIRFNREINFYNLYFACCYLWLFKKNGQVIFSSFPIPILSMAHTAKTAAYLNLQFNFFKFKWVRTNYIFLRVLKLTWMYFIYLQTRQSR